MTYIFRGDNTGAFDNNFITINAKIPEGKIVSKAKLRIGNLPVMTFNSPTFPLKVNLNSAQTSQLSTQTECYLAVYDEEGRKATCIGKLKFIVKDEVV